MHVAGQNSHCQSMTWPIMTMTRLRLIFPCMMWGKMSFLMDTEGNVKSKEREKVVKKTKKVT